MLRIERIPIVSFNHQDMKAYNARLCILVHYFNVW